MSIRKVLVRLVEMGLAASLGEEAVLNQREDMGKVVEALRSLTCSL